MISSASWIMPVSPHKHTSNSEQPFGRAGFSKANRPDYSENGVDLGRAKRRCRCLDLYKELVPYKEAWSWQKLVEGRRKTLIDRDEDHSDMLIILQHPPVYTLGAGSSEKYLNFDIQNAPHEIYRTERGGEVTYHGPGQLVMYPIINLRYHQKDVHWYLRSLEEVVIRVLSSTFTIKASRIEGLTGVWYNGCTWKGGKLRLEKAKEHYLARLKREWEEDAELMPTTPIDPIAEKEDAGHLKTIESLNQKNTHLRIFFPKLRKVKSLPFKGTGKHKYSFQRIDVPSLPIHFCDCEEHYDPSETTIQKQFSPLNKVMHEEEVRIMKSVMAKLLEKENNETGAEDIKLATHADVSNTLDDDIRFKEEEAQATDDDNLVTNIGIGGSSDILMTIRGKTRSTEQDSRYNKLLNSKDRSVPKKANSQERKKVGQSSLSKVTLNMVVEQIARDESPEISYENISTGGHSQEPDNSIKAPSVQVKTEQNMYNFESRKGNSWLQKSSWKDLVGEGTNISFSISNVLPSIDAMAPKVTKAGDFDTTIPTATKKRKVQPEREKPKSVPIMPSIHLQKAPEPLNVVKSGNGDGNRTDRENG